MSELTGTIHDFLSSNVILPLMSLQQAARPARRSVSIAFREGMRFRLNSSSWAEQLKREWMLERLRLTVRRAYHETPYYRQLFNRIGFDPAMNFTFDDFAQLPVLEREDIHQAGKALISTGVPSDQLRKNATGGSTGTPTEIWMGPEEEGWGHSGREFFQQQIGAPAGTRTGMLWGHHLDPVASDRLTDRFLAFANNIRWFDCFRLSPEVLEAYHREFERQRPACIIAYANALGHFAEYILAQNYRPSYPTRCFVTGAEKLLPTHREMIEQAFGRPVHERYGSRDIGSMGYQLNPSRTLDYTIDWQNIFVEPETDEADSPILITKLHADGMPMIRYRVGDVGRFQESSRPGHPAFLLREVLGRTVDRVWLKDGRWIHGIQMPHLLKDHPVRQYMLIQRQDYSVEVKILPKPEFGEESRQQIQATVAANLPGLNVTVELVSEIPKTKANKWRPVVSEVSLPRQGQAL